MVIETVMNDHDLTPENPNAPSLMHRAYSRFLKIRGQPREIALGFALGLFVAMTPTMGFQIAIAVFLATLLKCNKISAALGVWITNPITAPFIYGACYLIGHQFYHVPKSQLLPKDLGVRSFYLMFQKAPDIFIALIIGGVIIGLPLAIVGYYFSFSAVAKYQNEIKEKLARKREIRARKLRKKKKNKKRRQK
jgi:uncharacterized protein (DUF2062 family)